MYRWELRKPGMGTEVYHLGPDSPLDLGNGMLITNPKRINKWLKDNPLNNIVSNVSLLTEKKG